MYYVLYFFGNPIDISLRPQKGSRIFRVPLSRVVLDIVKGTSPGSGSGLPSPTVPSRSFTYEPKSFCLVFS